MKKEYFIDILHELIVVDTEESFVIATERTGNCITVHLSDGSKFAVVVQDL